MNWGRLIVLYGDVVAVVLLIFGCVLLWLSYSRLRGLRRWGVLLLANLPCFVAVWWFVAAPGHFRPIRASYQAAGRDVPELTFRRVSDGSTGRLSEFRGKVVVLNLWSTWCIPCRKEMPALDRLHREYREKGLVVLAVSDESIPDMLKFASLPNMKLVAAQVDPTKAPRELFVETDVLRPITHIIDRTGVLRETLIGEQTFESLENLIQNYL